MQLNSAWVKTCAGVLLTALLAATGNALADLRPMRHLQCLTLLVDCGAGFEPESAWAGHEHGRRTSVCLAAESAPAGEQAQGAAADVHRPRF